MTGGTTPAERLRELRAKRGYENATQAANAYGWPVSTYISHENGTRGITLPTARKYGLAYRASPQYILFGDRPQPTVQQIAAVPLLGEVAAGVFMPDSMGAVNDVDIPAVIRKDIPAERQYALRVSGPSVNKKIPDGAFAICAYFDSFPGGAGSGALVHVVKERGGEYEHTIKELRITPKGLMLMPVSTDPRHQAAVPYDNDEGDTVIRGIVIGVFQPL
jgi:SOS-response transcriptional repressor LexA